ncbi:MAG: hypothetical protein GEV08_15890 [Acidimicrobiia bacterium]|nr:hypothetical protein [Acidimicrobiia bacterium]
MDFEAPESPSPPPGGRRARRRLDRRVLAIGGALLALVAVVVVVVLLTGGGEEDGTSQDEIRSRLVGAVAEAQETARSAEGEALDVVALRTELEDVAEGWLVDLDAPPDRTVVGVAARRLDAPVCVFVWSAVGGPRSATVTDPNLPCLGAIARIAAR